MTRGQKRIKKEEAPPKICKAMSCLKLNLCLINKITYAKSRFPFPSVATDASKPGHKQSAKRSTLLIQIALKKMYTDVLGKLLKEVDPDARQN